MAFLRFSVMVTEEAMMSACRDSSAAKMPSHAVLRNSTVEPGFLGHGFQVVDGIAHHVFVFVKHFDGRPRRVGSHDEGFFRGIGQRSTQEQRQEGRS